MASEQQLSLTSCPDTLDRYLATELATHAERAATLELEELRERVRGHLTMVKAQAGTNPMIHLTLAEAIAQTFEQLVSMWEALPSQALPWVKGAMLYFAEVNDDDHDFDSPIGFEDDMEVLNACLSMAGRDDLCLTPEDFD